MGMMTGSGPLGARPAGTFNFPAPDPGRALYLEPCFKRIRVVVDGDTVADSVGTMLLSESGHQPVYYFPARDVRMDLLEPSDRVTRCPKKGEASHFRVRGRDAVAWTYPSLIPGAPEALDGLIAFYWDRVDAWFEEDEEVFVHPRDPYHRVDIVDSSRHVRVSLKGLLLAESRRPTPLFESNLPPRWYLPREDVVANLEPSETVTRCPYKGVASYWSCGEEPDLVWSYLDPIPEARRLAGLVCFFNERVDLELDGASIERPETPWRHPVRAGAR